MTLAINGRDYMDGRLNAGAEGSSYESKLVSARPGYADRLQYFDEVGLTAKDVFRFLGIVSWDSEKDDDTLDEISCKLIDIEMTYFGADEDTAIEKVFSGRI